MGWDLRAQRVVGKSTRGGSLVCEYGDDVFTVLVSFLGGFQNFHNPAVFPGGTVAAGLMEGLCFP